MTTTADQDLNLGRRYREVLAQIPKGVMVVAADGLDGPVGMTATAANALSLDPPLFLVCMRSGSRTLGWLRRRGAFGVSVLREAHRDVSERCAGRAADAVREVCYRRAHGVPVLDDALAWLACRVHAEYPGGDHVIVVGAVTTVSCNAGDPLVWHRSGYRAVTDLTTADG
ncbi:flavin reductase family protein [Micromonospora sp. NPDC048868]|uniref:flavin reductase family protein n=1 Tax=Micromonospora sp. NPDC048868 TaxID=3364258 RepID=UPI003720CE7E